MAAQVAANAFEPRERFVDGDAAFLACELYREAAFWALCALRSATLNPSFPVPHDAVVDSREFREALWDSCDLDLLGRVAGDEAVLATLRRAFVDSSFVDFAVLPVDEQARSAERLRALVAVLLEVLDAPHNEFQWLWLQRITRCGLVLVALVAAIATTAVVVDRLQPDLVRGKPWRASSEYPQGGCESPAQVCDDGAYYFFHTQREQQPWIEFDLGAPTAFTKVRVVNREDCCHERAVPLVIETSMDQKKWTRVARRTETFSTWTAEFRPTTARWLRLSVDGTGPLHLKAVRVQP